MKQRVDLSDKTILVTGAAGFIGAHLVLRLLSLDILVTIIGAGNLSDYYDPALKIHRLLQIQKAADGNGSVRWLFQKGNIADRGFVVGIFKNHALDIVVNLVAQAGVRYSIDHPEAYIESNIVGFYNILEACRHSYDGGAKGVEHLVYASSNSVYGGNKKVPFSTEDRVDGPVSLYAATKKSNELLATPTASSMISPPPLHRSALFYGLRSRGAA